MPYLWPCIILKCYVIEQSYFISEFLGNYLLVCCILYVVYKLPIFIFNSSTVHQLLSALLNIGQTYKQSYKHLFPPKSLKMTQPVLMEENLPDLDLQVLATRWKECYQ